MGQRSGLFAMHNRWQWQATKLQPGINGCLTITVRFAQHVVVLFPTGDIVRRRRPRDNLLPPVLLERRRPVASYRFSAQTFDPEALRALYAAFDAAWKVVEGETDASERNAVRETIALTILTLAKGGETDVGRLTAWAVARGRNRQTTTAERPVTVAAMNNWGGGRAESHRGRQALARTGRRGP
jgi:hypothetical protein